MLRVFHYNFKKNKQMNKKLIHLPIDLVDSLKNS